MVPANPAKEKDMKIRESEVTDESLFLNRREVLRLGATAAIAATLAGCPSADEAGAASSSDSPTTEPLRGVRDAPPPFRVNEELTSFKDASSYNNFYEFGTGKSDPARNSGAFQPRPWTVSVEGHCNNPGNYQLEDFLAPHAMEDRVYRMRCVEAWSMVVPWRGFPLAELVKRADPTGDAKFVEFTTLVRPSQMPGQKTGVLDWPYIEGLRLDEATNPLALLVTGVYGRDLPNQNGAPLRLITPWKYGFKGIKSIVRIRFVEEMPKNTWWVTNSREYGFYANVNPEVDHPRWSQGRERRIGEFRRRETLMFNGYADKVAHMYAGMDLTRWI
jgi:sulfoxide reductase catalytic subunit YedY